MKTEEQLSRQKEYMRKYMKKNPLVFAMASKKWSSKPEVRLKRNKYNRRRYWEDPGKHRRQSKLYRDNHIDTIRQREKSRRLSVIHSVLAHYGGKCANCGITDERLLCISPIQDENARYKGRKPAVSIYERLKAQNYPKGYRVLCFNCNWEREQQRRELFPQKTNKKSNKRRIAKKNDRLTCIAHYTNNTNVCTQCGAGKEKPYLLTLKHLSNTVSAQRKKLGRRSIWQDIIKKGYPKEYTILCWNCVMASKRKI